MAGTNVANIVTTAAKAVAKAKTPYGVGSFVAKGLGCATLALIAYDSHVLGKIEASDHEKKVKAGELERAAMHDLSQETPSIVQSKLKEKVFEFKLKETISAFFTSTYGYVKGFSKMLVNHVVPLTLAVGTVASPPGWMSKTFGAGLAVYGGIYLAQNVFGIGGHHE